ncbi:MAG: hypothetical protein ACK4EY_06635 [Flavipsychrobacter sp.]
MKRRLLVIRFKYATASCLWPIIINWEDSYKAEYETETIFKIISELQETPGVTKVMLVHNRLGTYQELSDEFEEIIGSINFNTPTSQLRTLSVEQHTLQPLNDEDLRNGTYEKYNVHTFNLPVRVNDPSGFTLSTMGHLPMLAIEY